MTTQRFAYRLGRRSWLVLRMFGVGGPNEAWVDLDETALTARFGWATATTQVANIARWRIEGPWRWITAIGIRRSLRHQDLTFGGSPHGGVRVDFHAPIKVLRLRTPALYLTVDDLDGLAAALAVRGIPGEDARRTPGA